MAATVCTIAKTEIKKIEFNKELKPAPNQKVQLQIKPNYKIGYDPERPLQVLIFCNVEIKDEETNLMHLVVETVTPIVANSFIDNLDELAKKEYVPVVLTIVAEMVRTISSYVGVPIQMPPAQVPVHTDSFVS